MMTPEQLRHWMTAAARRPLVMAILNVTPDSFSDGGRYDTPAAASERVRRLIDDGADLLDIGGESTRPGAEPVSAEDQIRRVMPAIALAVKLGIAVSVDTTQSPVAAAALEAGATIVNDVSAGRDDPGVLPLAASRGATVVLMHRQGKSIDMQIAPHYDDVTREVCAFLLQRQQAAMDAGIPRERIIFDPGIGFGKTAAHNLRLLRDLPKLVSLGQPLLLGTSRKRFIGEVTGEPDAEKRVIGTAATTVLGAQAGASIFRVHDARATKQALAMQSAIAAA